MHPNKSEELVQSPYTPPKRVLEDVDNKKMSSWSAGRTVFLFAICCIITFFILWIWIETAKLPL